MKTILIPTDFSKNANMALDFAISNLILPESKVVFLHVFQVPSGGNSGLFYLLDELQKQAQNEMEEFETMLKIKYADKLTNFETKIAQGDFTDQCNKLAREIDASCIVMGTKGASGIKEVLIGSNAAALMKNIEIPLYAIPQEFKKKKLEKLILSYDGQNFSDKVISPIRQISKRHDLPLKLIHVRIGDESPLQNWADIKTHFEGIKMELYESHGVDYEEGLEKGLRGEDALLVMVRRKRSFWERFFSKSDTRKIVMRSKLPILVVPE